MAAREVAPCRTKAREARASEGVGVPAFRIALQAYPKDPSIQLTYIRPEVCKHYLRWVIWILRVKTGASMCKVQGFPHPACVLNVDPIRRAEAISSMWVSQIAVPDLKA